MGGSFFPTFLEEGIGGGKAPVPYFFWKRSPPWGTSPLRKWPPFLALRNSLFLAFPHLHFLEFPPLLISLFGGPPQWRLSPLPAFDHSPLSLLGVSHSPSSLEAPPTWGHSTSSETASLLGVPPPPLLWKCSPLLWGTSPLRKWPPLWAFPHSLFLESSPHSGDFPHSLLSPFSRSKSKQIHPLPFQIHPPI